MPFFPIRSDRRLSSTPWMNLSIIALNVVVYFFTQRHVGAVETKVTQFFLDPQEPQLWQFITYQFLHGSLIHLAGNMLFLYVFGNSVEDRLGKVGYLFFYLAGGVMAGFGHALVEPSRVLGASGSVAAVTGAYLALFPMSNITIAYWLFFVGTFEVYGMYLILLQIAENIFFQAWAPDGVAYLAHLAGYAYGFIVGMSLLFLRWLPREPYDLLAMFERYRRRIQFRALTREGYQPWAAEAAGGNSDHGAAAPPASPMSEEVLQLRGRIQQEMANHNLPAAADMYEHMLELDPAQVMGRQAQMDIANQLMSMGRHTNAARAYEIYLNTYSADADREQIELILGLLYARYLDRRQRARELLKSALPKLLDANQKALAQQTLNEIG